MLLFCETLYNRLVANGPSHGYTRFDWLDNFSNHFYNHSVLTTRQGINILFAACSGLFIVIGVIIFGIENTEDFEELFNFNDLLSYDLDTYGSLYASFCLSAIAGALCLLVCLPLFLKDYLTPILPPVQQINPIPVQYTNQGRIHIPSPGQTHLVVNSSAQQRGRPRYTQAPAVYVPPGQQMQGQYVYPSQSHQQYGIQYPQQQQQQQQQYGVLYPQQDSNQDHK
ncbi:uncharacterized protein LOC123556407 [Mercenaria mercenaria]|uniref:uncharacterized protein LOC123556407 n=1 Tax=Mercenaria mercenaria TaxID=6596 RepID=UPI00234EDA72|nr:uncharacterized protein LOC123556407 [Mercenaria mercenaria]